MAALLPLISYQASMPTPTSGHVRGRLNHATLDLLSGADVNFRRETRLDIALVKNLNVALIFLPAADIPTFVGEGRVDLGITGRDQVAEHDARLGPDDQCGVEEILDLGFGGCKLQVQVPQKGPYKDASELVGKNVVTSFTGLTEAYFAKLEGASRQADGRWDLKTKVKYVGGSVEAACALGVADGIVDLVGAYSSSNNNNHNNDNNRDHHWPPTGLLSLIKPHRSRQTIESGETMKAAGLKATNTVVSSTAVLVKSRKTTHELVRLLYSRIEGVVTAKKYVLCQYNIPRPLLPQATNFTPGKRAPTVSALETADWVAVSAMVKKSEIANVMDELTEIGATDILCLPIMNSRTMTAEEKNMESPISEKSKFLE
ncbi:ATP phosphoribosyltransferase [Polytolypa hystricis UAMH7299]|uniref:ATP phosphoribosyltransferase n=1 Tax=Polytolypa hystricis (strain UAMH7299) TaxID=1447883 RepID=A0A2B7YUZ4_POLH7|nr:ATP phosphoribosyltransferase [Polytolypa hystricis UAMH7299]